LLIDSRIENTFSAAIPSAFTFAANFNFRRGSVVTWSPIGSYIGADLGRIGNDAPRIVINRRFDLQSRRCASI
jgi:hypothetical protein